jgi:hypothetical protein
VIKKNQATSTTICDICAAVTSDSSLCIPHKPASLLSSLEGMLEEQHLLDLLLYFPTSSASEAWCSAAKLATKYSSAESINLKLRWIALH